jgi:hypothetical protein
MSDRHGVSCSFRLETTIDSPWPIRSCRDRHPVPSSADRLRGVRLRGGGVAASGRYVDGVLGKPRSDGLLVTKGVRRDENVSRDEDICSTRAHDQDSAPLIVVRCPENGASEIRVLLPRAYRGHLSPRCLVRHEPLRTSGVFFTEYRTHCPDRARVQAQILHLDGSDPDHARFLR